MGGIKWIILIILLVGCTRKVVTFKSDTTRIIREHMKEVPAVQLATKPTFEPVIYTRILNDTDTVKVTQWKTLTDTIFTEVDCPDLIYTDTVTVVTNEKKITRERTGFGRIMIFITVGLIAIVVAFVLRILLIK